jgi:hypothetical protein
MSPCSLGPRSGCLYETGHLLPSSQPLLGTLPKDECLTNSLAIWVLKSTLAGLVLPELCCCCSCLKKVVSTVCKTKGFLRHKKTEELFLKQMMKWTERHFVVEHLPSSMRSWVQSPVQRKKSQSNTHSVI